MHGWLVFQDAPHQTSAIRLSDGSEWAGIGPWAIVSAKTLGEAQDIAKRRWRDFPKLDAYALRDERDKLRALLVEWQETEFFSDKEEWRIWVKEFGGRVRAALGDR